MKWILYIITGILVSMFYFPFEFTFLPTVNTKMMMAGVGLAVILLVFVRKGDFSFPSSLFILLTLSGVVSLIAYYAITYNQTEDKAYVTYIISAAVWLSAAYVLCHVIHLVHGTISVDIILNYMICVCVGQCILAMAINYNEGVMNFVDKIAVGGAYMRDLERLYGIGCGLDVAGTRFSCVLIGISFLVSRRADTMSTTRMCFLFLAFSIITVLGNMIARTTVVGSVIGLAYMLIFGIFLPSTSKGKQGGKLSRIILVVLGLTIPVILYYNKTNEEFRELMEFGFEGFYSLAEKGEWQVASNEILKNMVVWPDNLKTWVIGDGYFLNQRYDANYIGDATTGGFYMGTDVGYCRFIFYFGIIGLAAFLIVLAYAAFLCMKEYKEYAFMFLLVLTAGLVMFAKSSTDIFCFFCPFITAAIVREDHLAFGDVEEDEEEEDSEEESPEPLEAEA